MFLFVAGGTLGYVSLALVVSRGRLVRAARPPAVLWENAFAVPAIGAVYGVDLLVHSAGWNYFLSPLLGTLVYLVGLAVLVARLARSEAGPEEAVHDGGSPTYS